MSEISLTDEPVTDEMVLDRYEDLRAEVVELNDALTVCLAYIQKEKANPDGFGVGRISFCSRMGKRMMLDFTAFAALVGRR